MGRGADQRVRERPMSQVRRYGFLRYTQGPGELSAGAIGGLLNPLETARATMTVAVTTLIELSRLLHGQRLLHPPVPALLSLQRSLRVREYSRRSSHLAPPLSVTVTGADRLLDDALPAHLAVVQDVGQASAGMDRPADRAASFRNLLVPLVTRSRDVEGRPGVGQRPRHGFDDRQVLVSSMPVAHRAHQRAMARFLSAASGDWFLQCEWSLTVSDAPNPGPRIVGPTG